MLFRTGDIIECTSSSDGGIGGPTINTYIKGHLYRVTGVSNYAWGQRVDTVGVTVPEASNGWLSKFFRLAKPRTQRNLPAWW